MTTMLAALLFSLQATPPPVVPVVPPLLPNPDKPQFWAHRSPSCAHWRAARPGADDRARINRGAYAFWVQGYISGFNFYGPDPAADLLGPARWDEAAAFVDDYCARNPSHPVVDAMRPLALHFLGRRPAPARPLARAASGNRRAMANLTVTCAQWSQYRDNPIVRAAYAFGTGGFLTAYNVWGPDPTGDVLGSDDNAVVEQWLDGWCRDRPTQLLVQAVHPLVRHLAAERAAGRHPPARRVVDERSGR